MLFIKNQIYDDIYKIYNIWHKIDKQDFYNYRKKIILNNNSKNFKILKSSGSSSCEPKEYKWGPNFYEHWIFYNKLFFDNQEFVNLFIFPHEKNDYIKRIHEGVKSITLGVFNSIPKNKDLKISNVHVSTNPEVLYTYIKKYGDFISDFFNKKTCTFAFTSSAITKEHEDLFKTLDINYKDYMRCWDGGATYYTCKYKNKHWAEFSSIINFNNDKLISTDLWNISQKFINYWNKDKLTSKNLGKCECGMESVSIDWKENPRYFTIGYNTYCYDSFVYHAKKYGYFDYLYIEYSEDGFEVNISPSENFDIDLYKKFLKKNYKNFTKIKKVKIPIYERKFLKIRKIK